MIDCFAHVLFNCFCGRIVMYSYHGLPVYVQLRGSNIVGIRFAVLGLSCLMFFVLGSAYTIFEYIRMLICFIHTLSASVLYIVCMVFLLTLVPGDIVFL